MKNENDDEYSTLAEHNQQLKKAGLYDAVVEKFREADEERDARAAQWLRAERPLAQELRAAGYDVESAWDLHKFHPYPEAFPILAKHLPYPYPDRVREGIARALTRREAIQWWRVLVEEFRKSDDMSGIGARAAIAGAIVAAANNSVIDDVINLVRDPSGGESRILLLEALYKSKLQRALKVLEDVADDDVLGREARHLLKKLAKRATKAGS